MARAGVRRSCVGIEKWTKIVVEWEDSAWSADQCAKESESYMRDYIPHMRKLVGYFLGVKKGRVFVAMSDDRLPDEEQDCDLVWTVPGGMIKSVTVLLEL